MVRACLVFAAVRNNVAGDEHDTHELQDYLLEARVEPTRDEISRDVSASGVVRQQQVEDL